MFIRFAPYVLPANSPRVQAQGRKAGPAIPASSPARRFYARRRRKALASFPPTSDSHIRAPRDAGHIPVAWPLIYSRFPGNECRNQEDPMKYNPFVRAPRFLLVCLSLSVFCGPAITAPPPSPQPGKSDQVTFVHCGTLIDEVSDTPRPNALVEIADGKFRAVRNYPPDFVKPAGAAFIDLAG